MLLNEREWLKETEDVMDKYQNHSYAIENLRDIKKLQLRNAIQKEAFALFKKQSYDKVTMSQIAQAAKISRSTLFRYFTTKEAIVLHNNLDESLLEVFRNQPASYTTIEALRKTFQEVFLRQNYSARVQAQREELIRTIPSVRSVALDGLAASINALSMLIAERTGRAKDDILVRTLASALTGVAIGVLFSTKASDDLSAYFEESLTCLGESLHI